ncbi:MAG TPA: hypothetical protein VK760_06380 [Candidatus Acidoferrales bacterium]|nr:hypothetical protein [Candidatus Acidoferrales bacterium]
MLASSIGWILVVSGIATAAAGLGAFLATGPLLRMAFGVDRPEPATTFFARHWGLLILAVGALVIYSAYAPSARLPILVAGSVEKAAVVAMIFFGPLKRTLAMTGIAAMDGLFTILYVVYLVAG